MVRFATDLGTRTQASLSLGEEVPGPRMARTNGAEVASVQGDDDVRAQPLGQGNHRGVGPSEGEVRVRLDQLSDARPIGRAWRLDA